MARRTDPLAAVRVVREGALEQAKIVLAHATTAHAEATHAVARAEEALRMLEDYAAAAVRQEQAAVFRDGTARAWTELGAFEEALAGRTERAAKEVREATLLLAEARAAEDGARAALGDAAREVERIDRFDRRRASEAAHVGEAVAEEEACDVGAARRWGGTGSS